MPAFGLCLRESCYDKDVCDGTGLDRPGPSLPAAEMSSHLDCCRAAD